MRTWIICGVLGSALLVAATVVGEDRDPSGHVRPTRPPAAVTKVVPPQDPSAPTAEVIEGERIWTEKCGNCHTLGEGNKVGPDLRGVHDRREEEWLVRWLRDPVGMGKTDPIGKALVAQFYNTPMPPQHLDDAQISAVLAFVRAGRAPAAAR